MFSACLCNLRNSAKGFRGYQKTLPLSRGSRRYSSNESINRGDYSRRNLSGFLYGTSACVTLIGLIYAAVPLYRIFCQQTGFAGTPKTVEDLDPEKLRPIPGAKPVKISFVAETSKNLPWKFVPEQKSVTVLPGQTSLAFYSATNNSDREIVGMATYTVIPAKAAQYFNKIQCFCFEEQRLGPGEQVDMPVFFYLDPEYSLDPMMDSCPEVLLGYSFFETESPIKS